ncbi:MAG TPA: cysteine synthase family protein [Elusimicrobiales bacterium]|nr:cysteine synthase family protein [Elusimicrobiales bacterium]
MARYAENASQLVGGTPLLRLNKISRAEGLAKPVLAKLESCNPGLSVKDRTAVAMMDSAARHGLLKKDTVIIEASVGNSATSLAWVCALRGHKFVAVVPENLLYPAAAAVFKAFGAKLVVTPAEKGLAGAMAEADSLVRKNPHYLIMNQFTNPANPAVHETATAEEIWADTDGEVDIVVCGVGTGATLAGLEAKLKKRKHSLSIIAVQAQSAHGQHDGRRRERRDIRLSLAGQPPFLKEIHPDKTVKVSAATARRMTLRLAREEGVLAGPSSGAALHAALAAAKEQPQKTVVAVFPDSGERYLNTWVYEENESH